MFKENQISTSFEQYQSKTIRSIKLINFQTFQKVILKTRKMKSKTASLLEQQMSNIYEQQND